MPDQLCGAEQVPKPTYVTIAGTIGAGKSTTVQALATLLPDSETYQEVRDIYLERFYADPSRFGFLNQLAYSLQYLEQAVAISRSSHAYVLQDRSIYDTHEVFSRMRLQQGVIDPDAFVLLSRIARACVSLSTPDLLVHLTVNPTEALRRVRLRAFAEEARITQALLLDLDAAYRKWFDGFTLCRKLEIETTCKSPDEVCAAIVSAVADVRTKGA